MQYFLKDVASYLLKFAKGDLHKIIAVFPNQRARLFFNHYLAGLTEEAIWAPKYYTISDFVQQLSGLQSADQLTLLFRLFKVYKEVTGSNESFDTFYSYCETILADFDDIDKYRVNARRLYQNLTDLKAMEGFEDFLSEFQIKTIRQFWEAYSSSRPSDQKDQFISIWEALHAIYVRLNELLDNEGIAYEGKAYRKAIDSLESEGTGEFSGSTIAFIGFNALNHSEEILFESFKKAGNALFFWDYDDTYIYSDIHEAGFFLRKYLKRFPQPEGFKSIRNLAQPQAKITTISVPTNIAQAKAVQYCFDRIGGMSAENPLHSALILADETLLLPVINSLPSSISAINISMGYPVFDTPAFSFITTLADLQINRRSQNNDSTYVYYHKDFLALMNHVYLKEVRESEAYADFEAQSRERNLVYINPDEVKSQTELFQNIFKPVEDARFFGTYLNTIIQSIASGLLEQGIPNSETKWHLEVLHGIYKILLRYEALLIETDIQLGFKTVLQLLKKILSNLSVPFSGEPLMGLQVMGILETRTLDFENLIILSMNEGKFPKTGHVPSLIPYSLREGFGLPTVQHQDAIFSYYFYRLLHRSKNVTLVYNTKTEGLQKGEPSRFIYQLLYDSKFEIEHIDLSYKVSPFPQQSLKADKTPEVMQTLGKFLRPTGKSLLSPSAINTYLNCGLRFYFRYVEGMKEPEQIDEEIEANVFGSILHKAMEILYTGFVGKTVNAEPLFAILNDKNRITSAVDLAFASEYLGKEKLESSDLHGRNLIIRRVIEKYTRGILNYDARNAPFRLLALEGQHSKSISIQGNEVMLVGYIDRLDEKEGCVRVVDYKTGSQKSTFKSIASLFDEDASDRNSSAFQTLLYAYLLREQMPDKIIQPALFYVRNIFSPEFDFRLYQSADRVKTPVNSYAEYEAEFEELLGQKLIELFDSEKSFTQTEDTKFCLSCPYNAICMQKEK